MAAAVEGCRQQGAVTVGFENAQPDALSRRHDPEMIAHRHFDEGRDVEQLFLLLPDAGRADLARSYRQHVGVDIAKGVADLVDHQRELATAAIAEIDRERIEAEPEQPGITQEQHPPAGEIDAMPGGAALYIEAQRRSVALTVIGFPETVERRAIHAEQRRLLVGFVQPVKIDQKAHHPIAEAMAHRFEPRMHDFAEVERGGMSGDVVDPLGHRYSAASASSGGASRHGAVAPSASATARPERSPSS